VTRGVVGKSYVIRILKCVKICNENEIKIWSNFIRNKKQSNWLGFLVASIIINI